jgi:hypothetical protein
MPTPLSRSTSDSASAWVESTERHESGRYQFHWRYENRKGPASGRGSATLVPPDSLRFDFRLPLGSGEAAAAVIGNEALWAYPKDEFEKLVPSYPLLWALIGQARYPLAGEVVYQFAAAETIAWQYTSGVDTVDYIMTLGQPKQLVADVRQGGRRIGRVLTTFDSTGKPKRARLDVPSTPARLTIDFDSYRRLTAVPDSLWLEPTDAP